jgi:hypothetical protein
MSSPLPAEIRVEAVRDDVSYLLPVRPLGKLRWAGLLLVGFSVLFLSVPMSIAHDSLKRIFSGSADFGMIFFALFPIPFFIAGLVPMGIGLLVMFGRCRVDWRDKRLSVLEHAGPIRWRRRLSRPGTSIRKLTVGFGASSNGRPVTTGPLAKLAVLVAEFDREKSRMAVLGYPKDWLAALAGDLSARIGAVSTALAPEVELVDSNQEQVEEKIIEKPPDSPIRLETTANGLSLVIPPAGLWKGSKGLFLFAIVWCLFMTFVTGLPIFGSHVKLEASVWVIMLILSLFWAIGLGLLAGAINMGRRRALIMAGNGRLQIAQQGLFGSKRWEWPRADIAAIRADPSGMEVNGRQLIELQIHPAAGKKKGFFAGRDEDELEWMASELRRALSIAATEGRPR